MSVLLVCVLLVVFSHLPTLYTATFPQIYTPISGVFFFSFRSKVLKTSAETEGLLDTSRTSKSQDKKKSITNVIQFNNNNNLLHLYSAFLGTQSTLYRRDGISSTITSEQHPPG